MTPPGAGRWITRRARGRLGQASCAGRWITRRVRVAGSRAGCGSFEVGEELCAGSVARPEQAEDRGRGHDGARLANPSHDRAQMSRLEYDANTLRLEVVLQEVGDLLGQPLLDLEPAGVCLDDARDLRQADNVAARDVGNGRRPEERQEMVLA